MKSVALMLLLVLSACASADGTSGPVTISNVDEDLPMINQAPGKTGWSQSGTIVTQNTSKTVSMQANFPISGNYTAQFFVTQPTGTKNPVVTEALLTWAVEGNLVTRRVTVANGVSVTGVGQAVKIVISDVTSNVNGAEAIPYTVSVQVAPGSRPSTQQPPTLVPTAPFASSGGPGAALILGPGSYELGNQTFGNIVIPQDAGVISVFVTAFAQQIPGGAVAIPDSAVEVGILFEGIGAGAGRSYDPHLTSKWIPVPPGCVRLSLANNFPVAPPTIAVLFGVAFGIDG